MFILFMVSHKRCIEFWGSLNFSTYKFILCPDFKYKILKVNFWKLTTFMYEPIPNLT
jgi:hypothetical protein